MSTDSIKIELEVSTDNEGTDSPWWLILDPRQNMRADPHQLAGMITGPFFSRSDAEGFLKATRYNFSKNAIVYCHSGFYSRKYKEAIRAANNPAPSGEDKEK